jgi:adenine phosphoribosyltransferase
MSKNKGPRDDRWYLPLMAPNTKGEKFAWLDPTSLYINGEASHALLDDLTANLQGVAADVVAGLDAMGFVFGSALAARLGVGFLPIRKAGKLCVDTDRVSFSNYSGRSQDMEMHIPAFAPGTQVLIADQWVETGGTMGGAIRLIERQAGVVADMAAIAIEDNAVTAGYRQRLICASAVVPGSRWQAECDAQALSSFARYEAHLAFPARRNG